MPPLTTERRTQESAESRWQRVSGPLLLAGLLLIATLALHLRDPHRQGTWGFCPWNLLTGTYCPGCGGLRAVNDLTRGDVGAAFSSNALFVGSLPLLGMLWARAVDDRWRGVRRRRAPRAAALAAGIVVVLVVVFTVARNLPFGAWLAP